MILPDIPSFAVRSCLGAGGTADVFLAERDIDTSLVAIKVAHNSGDSSALMRTEAQILKTVRDVPYVVGFTDSGTLPDGRAYTVMEYCPGGSLSGMLNDGPMNLGQVLNIGVMMAHTVEELHGLGFVHRDIKPANILIAEDGSLRLSDFACAARIGQTTAAPALSAPWAAPELLADPSLCSILTDVYSLGATIYGLACGHAPYRRPHGDNSDAGLLARAREGRLPPLTGKEIPAGLYPVLARAMRRDPAQRYPTAGELANILRRIAESAGQAESATPLAAARQNGTETTTPPAGPVITPGERTHMVAAPAVATPAQPGESTRTAGPKIPTSGNDPAPSPAESGQPRHTVTVQTPGQDTAQTPQPPPAPKIQPARPAGKPKRRLIAGAAAVVVIIVVVAIAIAGLNRHAPARLQTQATPQSVVNPNLPQAPANLHGTAKGDGRVVFTWKNPAPAAGDTYVWSLTTGQDQPSHVVEKATAALTAAAGAPVCVSVMVVRADGQASEPATGCVTAK